jgi:hypothetical protein
MLPTAPLIHWKALKEQLLVQLLAFSLKTFERTSTISESFS